MTPEQAFDLCWVVTRGVKKRLDPKQLEILYKWASGEDTLTVSEFFGVSVPEVGKVKALFYILVNHWIRKTLDPVDSQERRMIYDWALGMFQRCSSCGGFCRPADKYCGFCGTLNSMFDESALSQFMEANLSELIAEECDRGHPHHQEDLDFEEEPPFCNWCGQEIYKRK